MGGTRKYNRTPFFQTTSSSRSASYAINVVKNFLDLRFENEYNALTRIKVRRVQNANKRL